MRRRTIGTAAAAAAMALGVAACAAPITPSMRVTAPASTPTDAASSAPSAVETASAAPSDSAAPSAEPVTPVDPSTEPSPVPTDDGAEAGPSGTRPADTVPITRLARGERPPQFVVVSFDGACRTDLFRHYLDLGRTTGARFTFFLSGLCLVPEGRRTLYHPPRKPVGTSAIGFASASHVPARIRLMTTAFEEGHEIGTHFLGHFCDPHGVGTWTTADWRSEMAQSKYFLDHWKEVNGAAASALRLPFDSSDWKGERTPCLLGIHSQMYPVFAKAGFTYDASGAGTLVWPRRIKGFPMWGFPLQRIKVVGYGKSNLSMDYNLLFVQNGGRVTATPAQCARIAESTYRSYSLALTAVMRTNRAPLSVGNHFNDWACNSYTDALTRFVAATSKAHPEVRFVTFDYLARWLDAQDPTVLASLESKAAPRY